MVGVVDPQFTDPTNGFFVIFNPQLQNGKVTRHQTDRLKRKCVHVSEMEHTKFYHKINEYGTHFVCIMSSRGIAPVHNSNPRRYFISRPSISGARVTLTCVTDINLNESTILQLAIKPSHISRYNMF